MSAYKHSSWSYAEALSEEDEILSRARSRGHELGVTPVSAATGSLLTVMAAMRPARTAVEIGSGVGVSGVSLLRGMAPDGILTTVEKDTEILGAARTTYAEAGFPTYRTRTINGRSQDVLPRLADAAYDLVFVDGSRRRMATDVEEAGRLLRPGGLLFINDILDDDQVPQPAVRRPSTLAARQTQRWVRDEDRFDWVVLPTGTGVMLGVLRRPR
ncbi:MAG: O-methyltransferase [Galactobacter sp.]|uniref:O-methyltransferase n=1 Tax=Galactobacter sp. TaxID=2676125 RepID=UPI0025C0A41F|nr:class I SAM-dependent methyltransferase [Galactobacter sp.]